MRCGGCPTVSPSGDRDSSLFHILHFTFHILHVKKSMQVGQPPKMLSDRYTFFKMCHVAQWVGATWLGRRHTRLRRRFRPLGADVEEIEGRHASEVPATYVQ